MTSVDSPSYDVVPLTPLDSSSLTRPFVTSFYLCVDGSLDEAKLRAAMEDLVTKKWRALGARLVSNAEAGQLEYCIPETFDDQNPPFTFTLRKHDSPINSKWKLPQAGQDQVTLHPGSIIDIFEGTPQGRDVSFYFTTPPPPILDVRVISFNDATLLTITLPHAFNDAYGAYHILKAWATCVNEGVDAVPDIPHYHNPLGPLGDPKSTAPMPDPPKGWSLLAENGMQTFLEHTQRELSAQPIETENYLHLPKSFFQQLHSDAQAEADKDTSEIEERLRISPNDAIVAWLAKAIYASRPLDEKNTPVTIVFPVDLRHRLPARYPNFDQVPYIHNAVIGVSVDPTLTVEMVRYMSVGGIAKLVRRTVERLNDTEAFERHIDWVVRNDAKIAVPFRPDGLLSVFPSWHKFPFASLSFHGALRTTLNVTSALSGGVLRLFANISSPTPLRRYATMQCGDGEGGIWVYMTMAKEEWKKGVLGGLRRVCPDGEDI
ncbi:hypothetical protein AX16_002769 [Volvariella volvacea WC 439]|nr:hypothetical protein AX16_002769 [Volvariella volvacea WC 439]